MIYIFAVNKTQIIVMNYNYNKKGRNKINSAFNPLTYFLIFIFFTVNGQTGQGGQTEQIAESYNPTPPEASMFIRVTDIPINESTGEINPNIPLLELNAGSIKLPISVSYSGNGIKIGQSPGLLGYNWKLNFGGMISRNVRDKGDDEGIGVFHDFSYYQQLSQGNSSLRPQDNTPYYQALLNLANESIDSEKDIFYFNFLGYSGSFIIEHDTSYQDTLHFKCIPLKRDNKISIEFIKTIDDTNSIKQFYITLPNGIRGIFGGKKAYQVNNIRVHKYPNAVVFENLPTSGFLLQKIIDPNGEWIKFEYDRKVIFPEFLPDEKYVLQLRKFISTMNHLAHIDCQQNYYKVENNNPILNAGIYAIRKIYTSIHDSIVFDYGLNTLNNIKLFHYNKPIRDIGFIYYRPQPQKRNIFLSQIIIEGNKNPLKYEFIYDRADQFPAVGAETDTGYYAVDYWGYYNGELNNTSLIPYKYFDSLPASLNPYVNKPYRCNRSPNLYYATIGTLNKIIYPTKGYHEFEYELPELDQYRQIPRTALLHMLITHDSSSSNSNPVIINDTTDILNIYHQYGDYFTTRTQTLNLDRDCQVELNLSATGYGQHVFGLALSMIVDNSTQDTVAAIDCGISCSHCSSDNNPSTGTHTTDHCNNRQVIDLRGGRSYTLILGAGIFEGDSSRLDANATLHYCKNDTIHEVLPGLRIKRIYTKKDSMSDAIIKRFYYNRLATVGRDTMVEISGTGVYMYPGVTTLQPTRYCIGLPGELALGSWKYVSAFQTAWELTDIFRAEREECTYEVMTSSNNACDLNTNLPHPCYTQITKRLVLSSNSLYNFYVDDSHKRLYPVVTVSLGGDHFEQGGIEKHFTVKKTQQVERIAGKQIFVPYGSNTGWNNGTLTKEIFYNKNLDTVKQTEYFYKVDSSLQTSVYNIVVEKKTEGNPCNISTFPLDLQYSFNGYRLYSNWISMDSIVQTEYFPHGKFITITKNYYPNHLAGLPDKTRVIDSKGDRKETVSYYPTENNINRLGLNGEERATALQLLNQHRFTSLLQKENYVNNRLVSAFKIHYKASPTNRSVFDSIILPDTLYSKKGNNDWETAQIVHRYNSRGMPQEFSKNGEPPHVFYVYGYHDTKIIAVLNFIPCKYMHNGCSGASLNQIQMAISHAIAKSNEDDVEGSANSEAELRNALEQLRLAVYNLHSDYRVLAAYTYDPLVGITGKMDEKGEWQLYEYDALNRLKYIKDSDGHIRKEYEYHYKDQ